MPIIIAVLVFLFLIPTKVHAYFDPLSVANNKYGIHIADTNDLLDVAPLINSTGGDWGYVTLVLPDSDKNTDKWQGVFNSLRRLHLIPIVRLATHVNGDSWVKPSKDDIHDWVIFLNSLNWPIENRYVALFNEPNHAKEWGGELDPEGYAELFTEFSKALRNSSPDYFILPAALDVSAANSVDSMDAAQYLQRMFSNNSALCDQIDGLNSHSYPNPGFSGSPFAIGRGTLKSYIWEESYLNSLGCTKKLPVFITETGWQHSEGKTRIPSLLSPQAVATYITDAAQTVWSDPQIVAVTPFVFSYQDVPFDHFSWKMLGSGELYEHANAYTQIAKVRGKPKQHESYTLEKPLLPVFLVAGSTYEFQSTIHNNGQNILDPREEYAIDVVDTINSVRFPQPYVVPLLEPNDKGTWNVTLSPPLSETSMHIVVRIGRPDDWTQLEEKFIRVVPPPSIHLTIPLGFKYQPSADHIKILIYDAKNTLIHEYNDVSLVKGDTFVKNLTNIIPQQR